MHDPWLTLVNQYPVPEDMCRKKMNGQTDSQIAYISHLWVMQNFDSKSLKYFVIDGFDLHIL